MSSRLVLSIDGQDCAEFELEKLHTILVELGKLRAVAEAAREYMLDLGPNTLRTHRRLEEALAALEEPTRDSGNLNDLPGYRECGRSAKEDLDNPGRLEI
jgi:hypothetical protein